MAINSSLGGLNLRQTSTGVCLCGNPTSAGLDGNETCCDITVQLGPAAIVSLTSTTATYNVAFDVSIADATCTERTIRLTSPFFPPKTFGPGRNYVSIVIPIGGTSIPVTATNVCSGATETFGVTVPPVPCCPYTIVFGNPIPVGPISGGYVYQVPVSFSLIDSEGCFLSYPVVSSPNITNTTVSGNTLITAVAPLSGGTFVFTVTSACGINDTYNIVFPKKECCDWELDAQFTATVDGEDMEVVATYTLTQESGDCTGSSYTISSEYFSEIAIVDGVPLVIAFLVPVEDAGEIFTNLVTSSCDGLTTEVNTPLPSIDCCSWVARLTEPAIYDSPVYKFKIIIDTTNECLNPGYLVTIGSNPAVVVPANSETEVEATLPTTGGPVTLLIESTCDESFQNINTTYPADPPCCSFEVEIVDGPTFLGETGIYDEYEVEFSLTESDCVSDVDIYRLEYTVDGVGPTLVDEDTAAVINAGTYSFLKLIGSTDPFVLTVTNLCDDSFKILTFDKPQPNPCCSGLFVNNRDSSNVIKRANPTAIRGATISRIPEYSIGTDSFAFEFWIYFPLLNTGSPQVIFRIEHINQDCTNQYSESGGIWYNNGVPTSVLTPTRGECSMSLGVNNYIRAQVSDRCFLIEAAVVESLTQATPGVWHHVVWNKDTRNNSGWTIYLNGAEVTNRAFQNNLAVGQDNLNLATGKINIGFEYNGGSLVEIPANTTMSNAGHFVISNFRMYHRNLAGPEILANYEAGCNGDPDDPTDLLIWNRLNETSGNTGASELAGALDNDVNLRSSYTPGELATIGNVAAEKAWAYEGFCPAPDPPCCNYQLYFQNFSTGIIRLVSAGPVTTTYEFIPFFSFTGPVGCTVPTVIIESQYFTAQPATSGVAFQFTALTNSTDIELEIYFCSDTPINVSAELPPPCCPIVVSYDRLVMTGNDGLDVYSVRFTITPTGTETCEGFDVIISGLNCTYGPKTTTYEGVPVWFTDTFRINPGLTEATFTVSNGYCTPTTLTVPIVQPDCCEASLTINSVYPTGRVTTVGETEFEIDISITGNTGPLPCMPNSFFGLTSFFWSGRKVVPFGDSAFRFFAMVGESEDVNLLGSCNDTPLDTQSLELPDGYENCCWLSPAISSGSFFVGGHIGGDSFEFAITQAMVADNPTDACNTYGYTIQDLSDAILDITPNVLSENTLTVVKLDIDYNQVSPSIPAPGDYFTVPIRVSNFCRTHFIDYLVQMQRPL